MPKVLARTLHVLCRGRYSTFAGNASGRTYQMAKRALQHKDNYRILANQSLKSRATKVLRAIRDQRDESLFI